MNDDQKHSLGWMFFYGFIPMLFVSPPLIALIAGKVLGCPSDELGFGYCAILGVDISEILTMMEFSIILGIFILPIFLVLFLIWFVLFLIQSAFKLGLAMCT